MIGGMPTVTAGDSFKAVSVSGNARLTAVAISLRRKPSPVPRVEPIVSL
jgi:hypothetical protein